MPGAYFGDEGKGKTVDAIAHHPKVNIVARVNSGENAGHTVFGLTPAGAMHKFAFNLCPSGLLTPGKVTPTPHPAHLPAAGTGAPTACSPARLGPAALHFEDGPRPAGRAQPRMPMQVNVVGPECVMDPVSFMIKEISQLTAAGVPYKDRLFIGSAATLHHSPPLSAAYRTLAHTRDPHASVAHRCVF